jgi:hypothetical protein
MSKVLLVLGRAVVKILIAVCAGTGVGLVVFGISVRDTPDFWRQSGPPAGFFLATGVGLLTAGALMMLLFLLPRPWKAQPSALAKGAPTRDWSE